MPYCELCGQEVDETTKVKLSGAEVQVCSECESYGTVVGGNEDADETTTKYSTSSSSDESSTQQNNRQSGQNTSNKTQDNTSSDDDIFDSVSDLAIDYGERIQSARSRDDLTREELARELGIKQSYLRNIENEGTQPEVELQEQIEKRLGIDLGQSEDLSQ